MPDQNPMLGMPPGVDPIDYAKIMRQSQVADLLQQAALSPIGVQQPQGSNRGFYQAARVSPLSGISRLAEAMMAKRAMDTSNTNQAQMYAQGLRAFAPGGGGAPAPAPAAPGSEGGYSGGAGASDAGQPGSAQPAGQAPLNPMNPMGQDSRALMRLYMQSPEKYLEAVKGTPDYQNALLAAHGNRALAERYMLAEIAKKGTLELKAGGEAAIPDPSAPGGYRTIRTPNLSANQDYTRNPDMSVAETHLIPGALEAQGAMHGREVAETHANTPMEIDMGGGVKALRYPGDVPGVGLPPSLRGPQAPGMPQLPSVDQPPKRYFPQSPGTAPAARGGLPQKDEATGTFNNNLWKDIPQMQIPVTPGQSTNKYQEAIIDSAAKKHQELVDKYGEASALAVQSNQYYDQALKHLPAAETGPMSEYLTKNRGFLMEMAPSLKPYLGGDKVSPTLELNKALVNAGLMGAKAKFGRITQGEVMLQKDEMSPSAKMTHDAIANLIHQQQIMNGYATQQDKDYNEYHAAGGDPNRFESQYNVRRPITRFASQFDTPHAALDRLKQRPELLPDFKAKFGWDPTQ